ncbi:unnamed protein product [Alopecurus aequalis]
MAASTLTATLPISSSTSRSLTSPAASTGADVGLTWTSKGVGRGSTAADHGQDTTAQVQGGTWKPALCVILVELFNIGTIILGKVALNSGMFVFSWLCYRSILGAILLLPFALLLERGRWKELDKKGLGWLFTNAFFGYTLPMTFYYYGLRDTPASYAVIFSCLTPLFTFAVSLLTGMESVHLKSKDGSAKVKVLKVYPWKHWSSVLTCALGGLQTYAIGIFLRRDKLAWEIGWNIQLTIIVYSAALGTAAKYWLYLYAVQKRGPVFPPMFSGLSTVFTMILGILLLGENLTIGSLSGSALIFGGLYLYLYGKANEIKAKTTSGSTNVKLEVQSTHDSKSEDLASGP